jgi:hypothetical protein
MEAALEFLTPRSTGSRGVWTAQSPLNAGCRRSHAAKAPERYAEDSFVLKAFASTRRGRLPRISL